MDVFDLFEVRGDLPQPSLRKCSDCKEHKPLSEFFRKLNGLQPKCKSCMKVYAAQRYTKVKATLIQGNYARRIRLAQAVDLLKEHPCVDCGAQYAPVCMDFDHLADKTAAISKMVHDCWALSRIKEEIAKCELVCVLCHKTRTHLRQPARALNPVQRRNKQLLTLAKDRPCAVCGVQRHPWQMEFDHLDPSEKREAVTIMVTCRYATAAIQEEISKCRVLCSLCHRLHTAESQGWRKWASVPPEQAG